MPEENRRILAGCLPIVPAHAELASSNPAANASLEQMTGYTEALQRITRQAPRNTWTGQRAASKIDDAVRCTTSASAISPRAML